MCAAAPGQRRAALEFTEGYEARSRHAPGETGSQRVRRSGASGPHGRYQKDLTAIIMG
ncbi:hypothetical protein [Brevundimonas diminuta]|uniref:hypothetical protein n=1 Tax=Brevundimonas diminuta TaxID=293 RepID=UPI0030F52856